jgi:hypothetical protein
MAVARGKKHGKIMDTGCTELSLIPTFIGFSYVVKQVPLIAN